MKLSRKFLALLLVVALAVLAISGCAPNATDGSQTDQPPQTDNDTQPPAKTGGYKVALVNFSIANSWRVQMQEEFIAEAERMKKDGIVSEYFITNSNNDISKQISDMRDMITKGVDAIVITAASPTALAPVVEEATDKGIKVVSFDNLVETNKQVAQVGIDEMEFGRIGAQFIADQLGGKGKIIVLNGTAGTTTNERRWKGAEEVFKNYPDIEILGSAYADWDYAKGKAAVESMLSAYPQIDAVWSQGGAMTQGAIDAFIAAGRKLVPMSGEGNNGMIRVWMENRDKGLKCIAPSNPTYTSSEALKIAIKALQGETVEFNYVMPVETVTEENVEQYYKADMPDSFWVLTRLDDESLKKLYADQKK